MYTFVESISNGYSIEILDLLSIFSLCAGIAVITTKNPIESLLGLIFLFAMIAIYLILCGFNFIGFSYLIVYIGAVSILFLFILMLINIRSSELQSNNLNSIALGLFIVLLINYILFEELPYSIAVLNNFIHKLYTIGSTMFIGTEYPIPEYLLNFLLKNQAVWNVVSYGWDSNMNENSHISTIGNILYTSYNMWLFMSSLILLLAMVGAIVITINKKKRVINSMVEWLFYTQFVKGSSPLFLKIL